MLRLALWWGARYSKSDMVFSGNTCTIRGNTGQAARIGAQRGPFMTILTVHSRLKRHLQGCVHARPYSPEKGPLRKVKVKVASRFAFTVLAIAKGSIRYRDHCALKGEEDINRFETGGSFANILLSQP